MKALQSKDMIISNLIYGVYQLRVYDLRRSIRKNHLRVYEAARTHTFPFTWLSSLAVSSLLTSLVSFGVQSLKWMFNFKFVLIVSIALCSFLLASLDNRYLSTLCHRFPQWSYRPTIEKVPAVKGPVSNMSLIRDDSVLRHNWCFKFALSLQLSSTLLPWGSPYDCMSQTLAAD